MDDTFFGFRAIPHSVLNGMSRNLDIVSKVDMQCRTSVWENSAKSNMGTAAYASHPGLHGSGPAVHLLGFCVVVEGTATRHRPFHRRDAREIVHAAGPTSTRLYESSQSASQLREKSAERAIDLMLGRPIMGHAATRLSIGCQDLVVPIEANWSAMV